MKPSETERGNERNQGLEGRKRRESKRKDRVNAESRKKKKERLDGKRERKKEHVESKKRGSIERIVENYEKSE